MDTHKAQEIRVVSVGKQEIKVKLQSILRNGKLAYLRERVRFSYEFEGDIRELVRSLPPRIHILNEPRISFDGVYDVFIGRHLQISTNIIGKFNKYEIAYIYVVPILFLDNFPNRMAAKMRYDDIFLYGEYEEIRVTLEFQDLVELFIGFLHNIYYLYNFFKIDQENKIIYYQIPKVISMDRFDRVAEVGMKVIEDAQRSRWFIDENFAGDDFGNWESSFISYSIFRYIKDSYVNGYEYES